MMSCRELVELLIDFLSGDLSPEERAHFSQHLAKCPPCAAYVETYQITIQLTRRLPCTPVPPELFERCQAAVRAAARGEPPPSGDRAQA